MKRLLTLIGLTMLSLGFSVSAIAHSANAAGIGSTFNTAMFAMATPLANDIVCEADVALSDVSARSEAFKCCSHEARFKAAISAVVNVQRKITNRCEEAGLDLSAIARICVNYEHIDDETCIAVATAWFACGCCVLRDYDLDECKYDEKTCDNHFSVDRNSVRGEYKCCEADSRASAIYDTMKKTYIEVRDYCALLDCIGGLGVRGFQIDFGVVDADEGVCAVKSTIIYSCCCVCE